jgi:hypothetical protein
MNVRRSGLEIRLFHGGRNAIDAILHVNDVFDLLCRLGQTLLNAQRRQPNLPISKHLVVRNVRENSHTTQTHPIPVQGAHFAADCLGEIRRHGDLCRQLLRLFQHGMNDRAASKRNETRNNVSRTSRAQI